MNYSQLAKMKQHREMRARRNEKSSFRYHINPFGELEKGKRSRVIGNFDRDDLKSLDRKIASLTDMLNKDYEHNLISDAIFNDRNITVAEKEYLFSKVFKQSKKLNNKQAGARHLFEDNYEFYYEVQRVLEDNYDIFVSDEVLERIEGMYGEAETTDALVNLYIEKENQL